VAEALRTFAFNAAATPLIGFVFLCAFAPLREFSTSALFHAEAQRRKGERSLLRKTPN
jgi:hypothetical protein